MTVGYSGTPLSKKLSLKPNMRVWWDSVPNHVREEILSEQPSLTILERTEAPVEAAHIFVTERAAMESKLRDLLASVGGSGFIWVSWPKKSSKVPTDITEDTIRDVALPLGLVDVKVCAVDQVWSGLKLTRRRE
jgi:hypothetical protein